MIYELLPSQIKILYLKMKTAASLEGYLDALRELLEELEFLDETKSSFMQMKRLLDSQELQWKDQFQRSTKWISDKLKNIKASDKCSKKIKILVEQKEKEIREGRPSIFQGRSYIEMKLNLLEQAANMAAKYGE